MSKLKVEFDYLEDDESLFRSSVLHKVCSVGMIEYSKSSFEFDPTAYTYALAPSSSSKKARRIRSYIDFGLRLHNMCDYDFRLVFSRDFFANVMTDVVASTVFVEDNSLV